VVALSVTTIPLAMEDWASLDALFSYRVCPVSFNKALQQTSPSLRSGPRS